MSRNLQTYAPKLSCASPVPREIAAEERQLFIQLLWPISPVCTAPVRRDSFQLPAHRIFTTLWRYLELWLAGEVNWIRLSRAVRCGGSSYRLLAVVLSPLICFRLGVIFRAHFYARWPSIGRKVGLSKTNRHFPASLFGRGRNVEC